VGPADYIALAAHFHTVVLDNIPRLHVHGNRNEIRRFINLIDELYNHKVKLICSSAVPHDELIEVEAGLEETEEKFMFSRVVSRLTEMQSEQYLETAHVGKDNIESEQEAADGNKT
jgi:cell division protein ZapE